MAKPKDAKVWNEDLVAALEARYQQSLREGKRNAHTWQKGMGQIAAVRKDIYRYSSGRIANLPSFTAANPLVFGEDGVAKVWTNGEGEVRLVDSVVHRVMRTIVKQDGQSECKVRRICTVGTFLVNARGALDAGAGRVGNSQC